MESLRLLNSLNTATFYVRFRSCFLLLARFFVIFSVFLIYFYCFLMISICFLTDFITFILKTPRNSITSANQHIMADDFRRISELVTLVPGFARAALCARAVLCALRSGTKFAKFARLYFPYFRTFHKKPLQFC